MKEIDVALPSPDSGGRKLEITLCIMLESARVESWNVENGGICWCVSARFSVSGTPDGTAKVFDVPAKAKSVDEALTIARSEVDKLAKALACRPFVILPVLGQPESTFADSAG